MTMNIELTQPNHIISLSTSAVLVSLDVNVWSATKQDREISDEVTTAKKADKGAGRFVKNILNNNLKHKAIVNYRQTMYNWLKRRTYRWNNSQDLLPSADLPLFKQEWAQHEIAFNDILEDFLSSYDSIVSNMAFSQGDMFSRDDYPHKDDVRRKFGAALFISEVPTSDFRCQISQDIAEDLHATYTKQTESIITSIQNEQAERLTQLLESIAFCCDEPDSGGRKRKVYDTTIEKAREMCLLFKSFNLANNPMLEEASRDLEKALTGISAETIRTRDTVRKEVKKDVDDILSKFGAFKCV